MAKRRWKTSVTARRTAISRANGKCEECGTRITADNRHVHHITYVRAGDELADDLVVLCVNCHGKKHPNHTFRPLSEQRKIAARRNRDARRSRAAEKYGVDPKWALEVEELEKKRLPS